MIQALTALVSPITSLWNGHKERKHELKMAQSARDDVVAEAEAQGKLNRQQIEMLKAEENKESWKDEFALLTISAPIWIAMACGLLGKPELVENMFSTFKLLPEWWVQTFQGAITVTLGIVVHKRVIK